MMKTNTHLQKSWLLLMLIVVATSIAMINSASLLALDNNITVAFELLSAGELDTHTGAPARVKITFGSAVTDFDVNKINRTPQTALLTNISSTDSKEFKIEVASFEGEITLDIPADTFHDEANDGNVEATFTFTYDTISPTVSLTSTVEDSPDESPIPITAVFSEQIYNFDTSDIVVDNGDPSNPTTEDNITFAFDVTPRATGKVTITIPKDVANDAARNNNMASEPLEIEFTGTVDDKSYAYLPIISRAFSGNAILKPIRAAGLTSFVQVAMADFSSFFPNNKLPTHFHIWPQGKAEPDGWEQFLASGVPLNFDEAIIGVQNFWVRFSTDTASGMVTTQKTAVTFFYLPNGDFEDQLNTAVWQTPKSPVNLTLPTTTINQKLRLGNHHDHINPCDGVPLGAAIAQIKLAIPPNSNYQLHIEGIVYTYDQLPIQNQEQFDAFEIHIIQGAQQIIRRFGNSETPLSCSTPRTVAINETIPLNPFQGETTISLQNWSRFDNFYNTYTEIDQIWIGK